MNFIPQTQEEIKALNIQDEQIYVIEYLDKDYFNAGITGSGAKEDLTQVIQNVRSCTNTPLYIGFGVDEKTAGEKIKGVDGVIVGSTFVKHLIDDSLNNNEKIAKIVQSAKNIKDIINS